MKCLVVLAHFMSREALLEAESVSRAQLAISAFKAGHFRYLVTTGWAYRPDCNIPISDAFKDYILENSDIAADEIVASPYARDTVGDAYFLRRLFQNEDVSEVVVATSDYHVERTRMVFEKFFGHMARVEVIGAVTEAGSSQDVIDHEARSTAAFRQTFQDTDFESLESIYAALSTRHPFYNGQIYPKIETD